MTPSSPAALCKVCLPGDSRSISRSPQGHRGRTAHQGWRETPHAPPHQAHPGVARQQHNQCKPTLMKKTLIFGFCAAEIAQAPTVMQLPICPRAEQHQGCSPACRPPHRSGGRLENPCRKGRQGTPRGTRLVPGCLAGAQQPTLPPMPVLQTLPSLTPSTCLCCSSKLRLLSLEPQPLSSPPDATSRLLGRSQCHGAGTRCRGSTRNCAPQDPVAQEALPMAMLPDTTSHAGIEGPDLALRCSRRHKHPRLRCFCDLICVPRCSLCSGTWQRRCAGERGSSHVPRHPVRAGQLHNAPVLQWSRDPGAMCHFASPAQAEQTRHRPRATSRCSFQHPQSQDPARPSKHFPVCPGL